MITRKLILMALVQLVMFLMALVLLGAVGRIGGAIILAGGGLLQLLRKPIKVNTIFVRIRCGGNADGKNLLNLVSKRKDYGRRIVILCLIADHFINH